MTTILIQARLTSTRLPGKVLLPLAGKPSLWHTITRCRQVTDRTVVAIPEGGDNDDLYRWLVERDVPVVRGPEHDVLRRMAGAAAAYPSDTLVRITGDCPLVDPHTIRQMVGWLHLCEIEDVGFAYVSNTMQRSAPRGLDVEVFTWDALQQALTGALTAYEREHVTPWIQRNLRTGNVYAEVSLQHPNWRWCIDTQKDYDWFTHLIASMGVEQWEPPLPDVGQVAAFLESHPELIRYEPQSGKSNTST